MAQRKAQLEMTADGSQARADIAQTDKTLANLGKTGRTAGKEVADGLNGVGGAGAGASQKVEAATRNMIGSIQRTTAALEAGTRSGSEYYKVLASQRGISTDTLKPYLDALDAANIKAAAAAKGVAGIGASAAQTAQNMRMVGPQVTDIVVGLASGQAPMTVLLQQGGQLRDMFGSIGGAAKALGTVALGLVNPMTISAAAAAALAYAFSEVSDQAKAYERALILTGNAAGTTGGEIAQMAQHIGASVGTQADASEALAKLAATGRVGASSLEAYGASAVRAQRSLGQSVDDTVQKFADLGKAPYDASKRLNESMRYLTSAVLEQIKALEDQGRMTDAAKAAQDAFAAAIDTRAPQMERHIGALAKAWRAVKEEISSAVAAVGQIGATDTVDSTIARYKARLAEVEKIRDGRQLFVPKFGDVESFDVTKTVSTYRDLIARLEQSRDIAKQVADAQRRQAEAAQAGADFEKQAGQFLPKRLQMEREIAQARALGAAAGKDQKAIDAVEAGIRAKYTDKSGAQDAESLRKSTLDAALEQIRQAGQLTVKAYANTEKELEAVRSAGLISESDYYEKKRELISADAKAKQDELAAEIDRLSKEGVTGAERVRIEKEIAKAKAESAIVSAEASSKLKVLETQQQAGLGRLAAAYDAARESAEAYYQTAVRKYARELDGMGKGSEARDHAAGLGEIEDRYAAERRKLEQQKTRDVAEGKWDTNADIRKTYEEQLDLLREYQGKEVAEYERASAAKKAAATDWTIGAHDALADYLSSSRDIAKRTESLFTDAFHAMEDGLVNFVKTGKLDFGSLVDTVISGLIRMEIEAAMTQLFGKGSGGGGGGGGGGWISSLIGVAASYIGAPSGAGVVSGGSGITLGGVSQAGAGGTDSMFSLVGGRLASGGLASAGGLYEVNEKGPELLSVAGRSYLMMGDQAGMVTPNPGGGGAAAPVIHQTNNYTVGDIVTSQQLARVAEQTRQASVSAMMEARARGRF